MLGRLNAFKGIFIALLFTCAPLYMYSNTLQQARGQRVNPNTKATQHAMNKPNVAEACKHKNLSYYLYVDDFINSFIQIPTSNVSSDSTTISSEYLAGRAAVYNVHNQKVGICSASFLCMQNENGIFTDIANYLSIDNGLIVTWFTPTTLINLELDSIVHSMVTECIVIASTKVGFNPFYGEKFNMVVSSDSGKIYFKLKEIKK